MAEKMNIGIVGAAGRGRSFKDACVASGVFDIHAVCDANREKLDAARTALGAREQYDDFGEMLEKSDIRAVVVATPMHFHVPQAIAALRKGIHVLSEVPAGVSVAECRDLVAACRASDAVYMMAENYAYVKPCVIVRELARKGLFGEPYYAEGEYLHELKELNEITVWRRKWQTGINGITYGTHSLGPILQWFGGQRVVSVCCAGSGRRHRDPRGNLYENEATCVMLGRMSGGGLVKIRVDMLSDRPHCMNMHSLQGMDGAYESARAPGEKGRIWLRSLSPKPDTWLDIDTLEEHLPERWRELEARAMKSGHGGGDFFEIMDFADAVAGRAPTPIGVHEAMDMTLPGLVSQESITQGGSWLDVPDSRLW